MNALRLLLPGGVLFGVLLTTNQFPVGRPAPPPKAGPAPKAEMSAPDRVPLLLERTRRVVLEGRPVPGPDRVERIMPRPGRLDVGLDILVNGRPLAPVRYEGKTYLPVPRVGAEYQIRVWNHGPRRVAAVVSVDGLSVINGRPASEDGPGYLVAPYSSILIEGWRRNLDAVAAFRFVDREGSYAARTGRPENVGVIGLVAIEEYGWRPRRGIDKGAFAPPEAKARAGVGSIGTEYGREIDSRAQYVPFVRSDNRARVTFYYDTVDALRRAGVPVDRPDPVPFPRDGEFAPPPPGHRGAR